jgi:hypothetical protein
MLNFVVIGSQKCGTTWLFDKLKMHPNLYFPVGKEGNYWNHKFYQGDIHRSIYHAAMNGPVVELCRYVCGDITPEYAIMSPEQIQNLHHHHPDIQLFLMVRNPILRAWSAIKMTYQYYNMDLSTLTDEQAIQGITTGKTAALSQYDVIIQNWLQVFDPAQLHIIFFDDLPTHYRNILSKVCMTVGTEPSFFDHIPDVILKTASMVGLRQSLSSSVYAQCLAFYQPSIHFLANYTGRNLDQWLEHPMSYVA